MTATAIAPVMKYAPVPQTVLLCCPACGRERALAAGEGLPAGLSRLIALCPDCEGHGKDAVLLIFEDGRVLREACDEKRRGKDGLHNARKVHSTRAKHLMESALRG